MVSKKKKRELMERIIDLAESVNNREAEPFEVDVPDFLTRLHEVFQEVENSEELLLDIRAILGLSGVISQQEDWIRHKSSMLHFDPMLVSWKVRGLSKKQLANVLVNSWHPIMEMENIAKPGIKEAVEYWRDLEPLSERGVELETEEKAPEEITRDELSEFGFQMDEDVDELIEEKWDELKGMVEDGGQISYWDFIDSESFRETVLNAWLTSFLISYGYASVEINPLEEEITLEPRQERKTDTEKTTSSIPIAISYEDWKERREQNA
ncbi:hypothetical protein AKJ51_02010 [candidate division MSBL1 archaeon SCGC-AAA382A20]|uniref:Non-structural maintenance of chromosome element 4 C-terminal domain-containing protein n=1 Tax=candidate division MSBL1 archaeon SCGC-AAA382A20 TaxID=1698280 RepID=A0A133VL04_9EURY|nr:hypothetical protein AKJ51_02010 [candidate division MSBL1 archaeon SCGC-AAA382A20]